MRVMLLGARIRERAKALGISQAEVGRRAKVAQSTINTLVNSPARTTPHLIRLAQVLETSPAYLMGETDDPADGAPPAAEFSYEDRKLVDRFGTLSPDDRGAVLKLVFSLADRKQPEETIDLPSEAALTAMYEGQLRVLGRLQGAELAHALAKRLPKALARLREVELYEETDESAGDGASPPPPAIERPDGRRSRRR